MFKCESISVCVSCLLFVLKCFVIIIIGIVVVIFWLFELELFIVGSVVLFICVLDVVLV